MLSFINFYRGNFYNFLMKALLSVDVEDWFQVENLRPVYPISIWDRQESRIERNIGLILDILQNKDTKGTFFVLGWIAERYPLLIKKIHNAGHEIGCHGYNHFSLNELTPDDFEKDIVTSKKILEDITGKEVSGYRAPNFSINDSAVEILAENNYKYDSSFFPVKAFKRYGNFTSHNVDKYIYKMFDNFYEVRISCLNFFKINIPWGGGGYFRLIPFPVFKRGVSHILRRENSYCFYIHPWEIDTGQPRVSDVNYLKRFRHYNNIKKTKKRLIKLVETFRFYPINSLFDN